MLQIQQSKCKLSFKSCILREKSILDSNNSFLRRKCAHANINVMQHLYNTKACLLSDIMDYAASLTDRENTKDFRNNYKIRNIMHETKGFPCYIFDIPAIKEGYQPNSIQLIILKPIGVTCMQPTLDQLISLIQFHTYLQFYHINARNTQLLTFLSANIRNSNNMHDYNTSSILKSFVLDFWGAKSLAQYVRVRKPNVMRRSQSIANCLDKIDIEIEVCVCKY